MKKLLIHLALVLASLFAATSAEATIRHGCRCDTGADPACIGGNAANDAVNPGTDSANPVSSEARIQELFSAMVPGDQMLLCKGGKWLNWNYSGMPMNGTLAAYKANPLILGSYTSPNFTATGRPILALPTSGCSIGSSACAAFWFTSGTSTTRRGGWTIQDIEILGTELDGQIALQVYSSVDTVRFLNMKVSHTWSWMGCSNQIGDGSWGAPSDVILMGGEYSYSTGMGFVSWGCDRTILKDFTIDHCATAAKPVSGPGNKSLDHCAYVSGNEVPNAPGGGRDNVGVVIEGLTITNSCLGAIGDETRCNCAIMTGHGQIRGWRVRRNYIYQAPGTAAGNCYGIAIAPGNFEGLEYQKDFVVEENLIVGPGNVGIWAASTQNGAIRNNTILKLETVWDNFYGILIGQPSANPQQPSQAVCVTGNTIYAKFVNDDSAGIVLGHSGTQHCMSGNIIGFGPGSTGAFCYGSNVALGGALLTLSAYAKLDRNWCFGVSNWAQGYATKAALTSASGGLNHDANSVNASPYVSTPDPTLGNGWAMPALTGGAQGGATAAMVNTDVDRKGCLRPNPPSPGAEDSAPGCTPRPKAAFGTR